EEMLSDRPVAHGVLQPDPRAESEVPKSLVRVDATVLGDRLTLRRAELADAAQRQPRVSAPVGEDADLLATRLDPPEVGDAVRDGAPPLTVDPLREKAVHVVLEMEHEVLADLPARVAEPGAGRIGEQAEPRRLDRARGEDEGVRRHCLEVPGPIDVLGRADDPSAVDEARHHRVEAELAAAGEERAPELGDGGRVLRVVRAAEAAAEAAVDARWAIVRRARVVGA